MNRENTSINVTNDNQIIIEFINDERFFNILIKDNTLTFAPILKKLFEIIIKTSKFFSTNKFKKKMFSKRESICFDLMQFLNFINQIEN